MVKTRTLQVDVTADRVLHLALPHDVPDGPVDIVMLLGRTTVVRLEDELKNHLDHIFAQA